MVYGLSVRSEHGCDWDFEPLDGDYRKVGLLDETPDEGLNPRGRPFQAGRAVDPTNVPTKVQWNDRLSPYSIPDFSSGPFMHLSARAKACIEAFEPGVHQFLPVEFVDFDGKLIEQRWFLCVCNRLDTIDRSHVQGFLLWRGKIWTPIQDYVRDMPEEIPPGYDTSVESKLVFNRSQIGKAHLWCDKHLTSGGPFITAELATGLKGGAFSGLRLSDSAAETV